MIDALRWLLRRKKNRRYELQVQDFGWHGVDYGSREHVEFEFFKYRNSGREYRVIRVY